MDITFETEAGRFNYRVCAVLLDRGRILAMHDERSPYFYLPGGRVRMGERAEDAVLREVREELGIEARILRPLWLSQSFFTEDVARVVGFSPNYLSRKFRLSAGIGLHEYIVFVRLHHAAQELIATRDTITEIALRCGFSDSNYFKDSFKKKYGVTPRNYRKMS